MVILQLIKQARAVRDTIRLNIIDLNYAYSAEKLDALNVLPSFNLPKPGLLHRIGSFLRRTVQELAISSPKTTSVSSGTILFFVFTKNQRDSLWPICQQINHSVLGGSNVPVSYPFPLKWAYFLALPFLPFVLWRYFQTTSYARRSFGHFFDEYWLIYGFYLTSRFWIQKIAPQGVVVANDHNYPNRVVSHAARDLHLPTFYFQHASVTANFPPLSFDFAMLEGMDALNKYIKAGASSTKVFLVGMPKADLFFTYLNTNRCVQSVSICTNNLDMLEPVEQLCDAIRTTLPGLSLTLRPHPGDQERWNEWIQLANKYNMKFSDSRVEVSFESMKRVDAIIVGDSNILLESALMDVYPLYYDFNGTNLDHYGFLKYGLSEYHGSPREICNKLRHLMTCKPSVRIKTKLYCHTVGTPYDGRSAELSANLVRILANGNTTGVPSGWRRVPNLAFEVYEPANL